MLVIGLTGSIGMGKSAAAQHLRNLGVPVCDTDAEVHRLYESEGVPAIEAAFPGTVREGKVDRALLAQEVAGSPEKLKQLESIVHPMVVTAEIDFLREQERQGAKFAVLEIPLPALLAALLLAACSFAIYSTYDLLGRRSEEHTSELQSLAGSRMPSSA